MRNIKKDFGLFSYAYNAEFKNLNLNNFNISRSNNERIRDLIGKATGDIKVDNVKINREFISIYDMG